MVFGKPVFLLNLVLGGNRYYSVIMIIIINTINESFPFNDQGMYTELSAEPH